MKLWVTRPKDKAYDLAKRLEARGHEAIVAPLLEPVFPKPPVPDLSNFQGFIATSARGLKGFHACAVSEGDFYDRPLFTVGAATSKAAKQLGWRQIIQGKGRAVDLVEEISHHFQPRLKVNLLHISGAKLAFDMALPLAKMGITYESFVTYDMKPVTKFENGLINALKSGELDGVTLLSPATADHYLTFMKTHGFEAQMAYLSHLCLSEAVSAKLTSIKAKTVLIAQNPTMDEFLTLLDP